MTPTPISALMTTTSYPASLNDWQGLFIRHLSDALAKRNDIRLHLWAPPGEMHPAALSATTLSESAFLARLIKQGGIAHLLRTGGIFALTTTFFLLAALRAAYHRAKTLDLYHVNWLQNALPLPNNGKPLLVSVLGTDMQLLKKPLMTPLLRKVFRQHPTVICPNADWMVEPLSTAFGDIADICFIPFGIDPMWYAINRKTPPSSPARWLSVTRLTRAKLGPLIEWCAPMFEYQERELHLFGPMQEKINLPEWVRYHGASAPDALCRDWFPTTHGLITLSQHAEGRPQVMLEAMASGLPIVASNLPAHKNIVVHNKTGWLCECPKDVVEGIEHFENSKNNHDAGVSARAWALQEIGTWDDCAARYANQYKHLLGKLVNG